jgi:glycosyltransferase involved in cell wall biosynthesis
MPKIELMNSPFILVAPFSPIGSCESPHLGGAKKIVAILQILSRFGHPVVLINSAHNKLKYVSASTCNIKIGSGKSVTMITPFTLSNRKLGKLLNLFETNSLARQLATQKPAMVWIYNGYAFEAKFAAELNSLCDCPIILEIEDWHTARSRGLNPKPAFDLYYFHKVLKKSALVTCVNEAVRKDVGLPMSKTMLLPSIIDERLIKQASNMAPFSRRPFGLGYFGGLTEEKGADIVLALGKQLPSDWHLVVTGSGHLAASFSALATNNPTRVRFINNATEDVLYHAMLSCDAIVNPHKSITSMGDGIFPFKVFEALASGRLLISTDLPDPGLSLSDTVMFFDGSLMDLVQGLGHAEEFYQSRQPQLSLLKEKVIASYSEDAVYSELSQRMNLLGISPENRQ